MARSAAVGRKGIKITTLLSFHNDSKVKEKYVARLKAHAKADEFIKRKYWENGKGCAVGCTVHSNNHAAYETELGIPEWLARLEDKLFEGLDKEDAKTFAIDFLASIPIGVDLRPVKWKFRVFILNENIERVLSLKMDEDLKQKAVLLLQGVLKLYEKAAEIKQSNEGAVNAAMSAEKNAIDSAAANVTNVVFSTMRSSWIVRKNGENAAYKRYADELIRLLKESK